MGTLISSNALTDSERRVLFLKRRYELDIRSGLNGMRIGVDEDFAKFIWKVGIFQNSDQNKGPWLGICPLLRPPAPYWCTAAPPSTPRTRPRVRSCPGARGGAPEENFGP